MVHIPDILRLYILHGVLGGKGTEENDAHAFYEWAG